MSAQFLLLSLLVASVVICQQLPVQLPPTIVEGASDGSCSPSDQVLNNITATVQSIVDSIYNSQPPCPCGGPGLWNRVAHLDMSDPNQQCPTDWNLITSNERACGRSTFGLSCDSAVFPTTDRPYSHVCGRIIALQRGSTDAFSVSFGRNLLDIEGSYLDGVSLTHGPAGSRQHIWSFAAALYETDPIYVTDYVCECTNTDVSGPYNEAPPFVGNDYFCDTGNRGPNFDLGFQYSDDPLWDGGGCGPTNACCQLNTPPWFCTTLAQPTTDDLELRICTDESSVNEDVHVRLVDIYTM